MQFKGQLLLPGDPGPGLPVHLDVAEHHLAVESDGGGLGAWPLEVVDVERLESDIFGLTVAGEPLRFVADDSIDFAYSGMPAIERISRRPRARTGLRGFLDRIWNPPEESTPTAAPPTELTAVNEPGEGDDDHSMQEIAWIPQVTEKIPAPVEEARRMVTNHGDVGESVEPEAQGALLPDDAVSDTRCPAVRGDGSRCESPILTTSGYCYPHDPRRAFDDKYKAAQEARVQIKREATARLNRIYKRLAKAMRQVERGELDPETAMAMAQLARTMCAILDVEAPDDRNLRD
jgi:hypothetical protein